MGLHLCLSEGSKNPQLSAGHRVPIDMSSFAYDGVLPIGSRSAARAELAGVSLSLEHAAPLSGLTDAEVMLRVKSGDDTAFNYLVEKFRRPMISFMYRMTHNSATAEDLAQEVFLKLWQQIDRLNGVENVKGYLFIMARNNCHNHYKKALRRKPLYKNYCRSFTEVCYHDEVVVKELNRITIKAVQELPAKQKKVFIYRDMGLGRKEIADILNVSVNTIDACINIAMKKVQQYVSRELELSTAA